MNLNKLKSIFTLKRVAIFFMSIFLILFLAGGCSFKYMDWQYYVARNMCQNVSGYYIYDEQLYGEALKIGQNSRLSNGYMLKLRSGYGLYEKEKIMPTEYSRLVKYINYEYFYTDSNGKQLIYQGIDIGYHNYGLWLSGGMGAGVRLNEHEILTCRSNTHFILKDEKWQITKNK